MFRNHSISLSLFFCFITIVSVFSQLPGSEFQSTPLSKSDSIIAAFIPELKLPDAYKHGRAELPWKINNAETPYFRSIFSQEGACCGQASGVSYNFTYEINCARGVSANIPENQYPTHFSWNIMNGGDGWRGVSYFHSFDLLKACGTPNVSTYGGQLASLSDRWWMSGYDKYFSAMQNRIQEVYFIDVSSADGLVTLKHWLNDHMNGTEVGGVASFYASSPWNSKTIPPGSPEAGKHVMTEFLWPASHAMTIVGYNDSVQFDVNQDGEFTNDIDINDDGVINMKDWEVGALLFANSYGETWLDSGFCYMMYRTLAEDFGQGGIWNNAVHVLTTNESYAPQLTMRVKIRHNSREKIKILAGVSSDTILYSPLFSMDFPLLNFQGGNHPMQGLEASDTLNPELMEIELDVTPLLGHIESGKVAKFFFQIVENDPKGHGTGELLRYSLIDRTSENPIEVVSTETPIPIAHNSISTLSLLSTLAFDKIEITTEELPVFSGDENYTSTFESTGGQAPNNWSLLKPYTINAIQRDFPEIQGEALDFAGIEHAHYSLELAFPFPFYGDSMQQVSVSVDGLVSFEDEYFAYPYYYGETTMLTDRKVIAPFMSNLWVEPYTDYGVWIESTPEYFGVRWSTTYDRYNVLQEGEFNFALKLFPDGRIETYYGEFKIPSYVMWASGISSGDKANYTRNHFSQHLQNPNRTAFEYIPPQLPEEIMLTSSGELQIPISDQDKIYQLTAQVEDINRIIDHKTFQLSSGLIYHYEIQAGEDEQIDFGDTASLKLIVKNISNESIENIGFLATTVSNKVSVIKSEEHIGNLAAGESKTVDGALVFSVESDIPDQYNFSMKSELSNDVKSWNSNIQLTASAMQLNIVEIAIADEGNGFLEPGETATLQIEIQNLGHAHGENLDFNFVSNSDYLVVNTPIAHIDNLAVGGKVLLSFNVSTRQWTPSGYNTDNEIILSKGNEQIQSILLPIKIGKVPALVLNLEETTKSSDQFCTLFDSLQLVYEFRTTFPENLDEYNSIFICLGSKFDFYSLSWSEGNWLKNYLLNGGKIYMEGMRTWLEDEAYAVHGMFGFEVVSDGNYFEFDHMYGVEGTQTEGISMVYGGSMPFNNHYLLPTGTAFPFLRCSPNDTVCTIANDTADYKTIGSSVLFGEMKDSDTTSTTSAYVQAILEFFDIKIEVVDIPEITEFEQSLKIELFPNPFEEQLHIRLQSSESSNASIEFFSIDGQLIHQTSSINLQQDQTIELFWDGCNIDGQKLPPGIYFIRIVSGDFTTTKKVVLR